MTLKTAENESEMNLHSCLITDVLIGENGHRAACRGLRMSLHIRREIRVSSVVTRQNAARVFMTGLGLPGGIVRPCAVARCLAK